MKYLKKYDYFIEGKVENEVFPYPSDQKLDKKKSIVVVSGGHIGDPKNDYSKIAPALLDTYNVYSFYWPEKIDGKQFAQKIVPEIEKVVKTPFC